jgi:sRNA-binding regulator protein Hfq
MRILLLAGFLLTTQASAFHCNPYAIVFKKSSSAAFGVNSTYSEDLNVSVPIQFQDHWGCYQNKQAFKLEKKQKKDFIQVDLTPQTTEFIDVPEASVGQYIHIDQNKIFVATFLCSGEKMIGHSSFSDFFLNLPAQKVQKLEVNHTFATGMAARILEDGTKKSEPAMEKFAALYGVLESPKNQENCFVPAIISTTTVNSVQALSQSIESAFRSKTNAYLNGCTSGFKEKMQAYRIENVLQKSGKRYSLQIKP